MRDTPTSEPTVESPRVPSHDAADDRKAFVRAGIVIGGVIVALTLLFMAIAPAFDPGEDAEPRTPTGAAIAQPYGGAHPERPGDRGGWEQLALLGVIVVAMGGGAVAIVHSSRTARRRRDADQASTAAN